MSDPKLTINRALYDQLATRAEKLGYSSAAEYATHLLETAVADSTPIVTDEQIRERLKGLGYLK
jgi:hypothetical protein